MKKQYLKKLLMIAIVTPAYLQSSYNYDKLEHHRIVHHPSTIIPFIADDAFGNEHAEGEYNHKNKTAVIINADSTSMYSFKNIIITLNPSKPHKKTLPEDLVKIGSYSRIGRVGMPVTIYLFGILVNKKSIFDTQINEPILAAHLISKKFPVIGGPDTFAPIVFIPSEEFSGPGLVGNYFKEKGIATIHDPYGKNNSNYTFENVEENGMSAPENLICIGSYMSTPSCSPNHVCAMVMRTVNLYGKQIDNPNN